MGLIPGRQTIQCDSDRAESGGADRFRYRQGDLDQSDRTEIGMMIGTVAYAAPEQLEGERVDTRADLFGLGATLYYLLTLQRPYADQERTETAHPFLRPSMNQVFQPTWKRWCYASWPIVHNIDIPTLVQPPTPWSKVGGEGVPIAGRQDALRQVAQALRMAESGSTHLCSSQRSHGCWKRVVG